MNRGPRRTLLDLFIDDDPGATRDRASSSNWSWAAYEEAVRRDLQWLLNARRWCILPTGALEKGVAQTIHAYGMPSLGGANIEDRDTRARVRRQLKRVIEDFEPRLTRVRVVDADGSRERGRGSVSSAEALLRRSLAFRIEAVLVAGDDRSDVAFESRMDALGPGCSVRRSDG